MTEFDLLCYFNEELSPSEEQEVQAWRDQSEENRNLFQQIQKEHSRLAWAVQAPAIKGTFASVRGRVSYRFLSRRRLAAVAAVVALVVSTSILSYQYLSSDKYSIAHVGPPENAAILELSDGTRYTIGADYNEFTEQDGTVLVISDGGVTYDKVDDSETTAGQEVIFNKMTVTRGASHFRVVLPDGSVIWLNSDSHLEYPVTFSGDERRVRIVGEAYFDVVADAHKPFIVETEHQSVSVLGTKFNIATYPSEPVVTTLVSGSVSVDTPHREAIILCPGEQSTLDISTGQLIVSKVSTEQFVSWKDGMISIETMPLSKILTLLSRRYNVEFQVDGPPSITELTLWGSIPSDESLEVVLSVLERVADVKFKMDKYGEITVFAMK